MLQHHPPHPSAVLVVLAVLYCYMLSDDAGVKETGCRSGSVSLRYAGGLWVCRCQAGSEVKGQRSPPGLCVFVYEYSDSVSLNPVKPPSANGRPRPKRRISFSFSISPLLPKSRTLFSIGSSSSDEEEFVSKYRRVPRMPCVAPPTLLDTAFCVVYMCVCVSQPCH